MVFGKSPFNELLNDPKPEPSIVLVFAIVGLVVILLQQTPREVIAAPPSLEIDPPLDAVVYVIADVVITDIDGSDGDNVLNVIPTP